MFGGQLNIDEFEGDIKKGDLINLKPEMMLVDPKGPVLVIEANNEGGFYDVMYTSFEYFVGVGRMDIAGIASESR